MSDTRNAYEVFVDLVAKMREYQIAYFKSRTQRDLNLSRRYEGMVDAWLKQHEAERLKLEAYLQRMKGDQNDNGAQAMLDL